ncbi:hypothetical protein Acr_26g0003460 [Actinidia rufa]|uniref:Uncharacterized protein n=1 Tax=Actinidia rufa TaxID=165716 RepID=A0A7J0H1Y1_9ERIC|nr:hypothetical protein Acr_26g0003460 [Actinidia rufa]
MSPVIPLIPCVPRVLGRHDGVRVPFLSRVMGLKWYARRLKIDDDGDVADEFFEEILLVPSSGKEDEHQHPPFPRLQLKCNARPAKVRNQTLTRDGKVLQRVEHQGRLQWV